MTNDSDWLDDGPWRLWKDQWSLRSDTTYLNHGSFGPSPLPVRHAQTEWTERLENQPMDFFVRTLEPELQKGLEVLGRFVGAAAENLVFAENATYAMNILAVSFDLQEGDEVLVNDHEYGAVIRLWETVCAERGARLVTATLPQPVESADQVIDALFASASERTRLIIVSHITSPTAMILPVQAICQRAQQQGIQVCIDGPHAIAQIPLDIESLGCDYYTASCHKWLCAPFGSGFLYASPDRQASIRPLVRSWGRWPPVAGSDWRDEFFWQGTRDAAAYLSTGAAIEFMESVPLDPFRNRTHALARYARAKLAPLADTPPLTPDCNTWYASMALAPLPAGEAKPLQEELWSKHGMEAPVIDFHGRRFIRVSCHLYNDTTQIDQLAQALGECECL